MDAAKLDLRYFRVARKANLDEMSPRAAENLLSMGVPREWIETAIKSYVEAHMNFEYLTPEEFRRMASVLDAAHHLGMIENKTVAEILALTTK